MLQLCWLGGGNVIIIIIIVMELSRRDYTSDTDDVLRKHVRTIFGA